MKKLYFLLANLLLISNGFSQTLDQTNFGSTSSGWMIDNGNYTSLGQGFRAGATGQLAEIHIELDNTNPVYPPIAGTSTITVFSGVGFGGTVLGSTTFTTNGSENGEYTIPLSSANINVISGNDYTFRLNGCTGRLSMVNASGDNYANGVLYYTIAANPPSTYASGDLKFKTYVTVPSPGTNLSFDGSNDRVDIGNLIPSGTSYTKEMWVKTTGVSGNNLMSSNTSAFWFYNGNLQCGHGGGFIDVSTSAFSFVNVWTHVAVTYDAPSTTMKLYVNGVLASQNTSVGAYNAGNIQLGAYNGMANFGGDMDEVRLWNYAVSEEDLSRRMSCEIDASTSGLIAYYKFNQGIAAANNSTVTQLTDASVNGNNGTLVGFALTGASSNWISGSPITTGLLAPSAPSVTSPVNLAVGSTASSLNASGTGLTWYTSSTGGTGSTTAPTPSTSSIGTTSYWVASSNANGCESTRSEIIVNVLEAANNLDFAGGNDIINLGTGITNTINTTQAFTIEAWFNQAVPTGANNMCIVGNHENNTHVDLRIENDQLKAFIGFGALSVTAPGTLSLNTWYHAAVSLDDQNLSLYLNGVLVATTPRNGFILPSSSTEYRIGADYFAGRMIGKIDEVRIFDTAMSTEFINRTMSCEIDPSTNGLIAYYQFNQGLPGVDNSTTTILNDATANTYNGTLTGFALNGSTSNWSAGSPVTSGDVIPAMPTGTNSYTYCFNETATQLSATGTNVMWFTTATGGTGSATAPTPLTNAAGSSSYWAASTNASGCESERLEIIVDVLPQATGTDVISACGSYEWIDGNTYNSSNSTATYTYANGAANGCDSVVTLNLTINSIPTVTATNNGDLTITASTSTSYQWINCNSNQPIANATGQTYTATANGSYAVIGTNASGCSDTSNCVTINNVSLNEENLLQLVVSPNPANNVVTIDGNITQGLLVIRDAQGKLLNALSIGKGSAISLIDFASGIYFFEVQSQEGKSVVRVVKN